jgi:hypothetical protein
MVRELLTVGSAKTYFPDQPVMLKFVRHGDQVTVSSRVGSGPREATASLSDFVVSLREAGTIFFVRMSELEPLSEPAYRPALRELNDEPPASAGGVRSG